jgi:broad specificity phosphatase PhoE
MDILFNDHHDGHEAHHRPSLPDKKASPAKTCGQSNSKTEARVITVYLIRHGESLGQCCTANQRRSDLETLTDCRLSPHGKLQALNLVPQYFDVSGRLDSGGDCMDIDDDDAMVCDNDQLSGGKGTIEAIHDLRRKLATPQRVWCSPLSRAIETSVLAFGGYDIPVTVHYDLREIGTNPASARTPPQSRDRSASKHRDGRAGSSPIKISKLIPENIPRPTADVLEDFVKDYPKFFASSNYRPGFTLESCLQPKIDFVTYRPPRWPRRHDVPTTETRRSQVVHFFKHTLPEHCARSGESVVAVICHYHVIRAVLSSSIMLPSIANEDATANAAHLVSPPKERADGRTPLAHASSANYCTPPRPQSVSAVFPATSGLSGTSGPSASKAGPPPQSARVTKNHETSLMATPDCSRHSSPSTPLTSNPRNMHGFTKSDIHPANAVPIVCELVNGRMRLARILEAIIASDATPA